MSTERRHVRPRSEFVMLCCSILTLVFMDAIQYVTLFYELFCNIGKNIIK